MIKVSEIKHPVKA